MEEQELINTFHEYLEYNETTGMLHRKKIEAMDFKNKVGDAITGTITCKNLTYYAFRFKHGSYKAHRVIWAMVNGEMPDTIDHADGNGLNNRLDNLVNTTQANNCKNRRHQTNSSTGYSGITKVLSRTAGNPPKYLARINTEPGKRITIGRYDTFEEAISARKLAETEYGYHENHCTR